MLEYNKKKCELFVKINKKHLTFLLNGYKLLAVK